jgi:hypothetical protein
MNGIHVIKLIMMHALLLSQGLYLDEGVEASLINVFIGDTVCNVTQLGSTALICHPHKPAAMGDDEPFHHVVVRSYFYFYSKMNVFNL